jgi:hypothetical protein
MSKIGVHMRHSCGSNLQFAPNSSCLANGSL